MYHPELGKTTLEIWDDERREARLRDLRKREQLRNVATGLGNLLRRRELGAGQDTAITIENMNGVDND